MVVAGITEEVHLLCDVRTQRTDSTLFALAVASTSPSCSTRVEGHGKVVNVVKD